MVQRLRQRLRGSWLHRVWRRARGLSARPADALAQNAAYDRETIAVIERGLQPASVAVDVGAHQGSILQHLVRVAPLAQHHAIEPIPSLAQALRQAFPHCAVHEVALGAQRAQATFQLVENDPAYSGLRQRIYDRPDPQIRPITVEVYRLDDLLPPDLAVALIKLDIEGGEYHALRGASATIRRCRPLLIFEFGRKTAGAYGVTPEMLFDLITVELGYQLSTMRRWLDAAPAYTRREFLHNWHHGPDYYFLAAPQ